MPHRITQCYLPPGRADIPALTPAEAGTRLSDPGGMHGWVDLVGWLHTEMYTRPKTVTHPGTNRARRALTSFLRRTLLTITPSSVVGAWNSYWAVVVLMQAGLRRRRRMDNAWCSFPSVSLAISLSPELSHVVVTGWLLGIGICLGLNNSGGRDARDFKGDHLRIWKFMESHGIWIGCWLSLCSSVWFMLCAACCFCGTPPFFRE